MMLGSVAMKLQVSRFGHLPYIVHYLMPITCLYGPFLVTVLKLPESLLQPAATFFLSLPIGIHNFLLFVPSLSAAHKLLYYFYLSLCSNHVELVFEQPSIFKSYLYCDKFLHPS